MAFIVHHIFQSVHKNLWLDYYSTRRVTSLLDIPLSDSSVRFWWRQEPLSDWFYKKLPLWNYRLGSQGQVENFRMTANLKNR